jgi:hypothetical protein
MADVSHIITQGIGTPAGIAEFILFGLQPSPAGITYIDGSATVEYASSSITLTLPTHEEDDLLLAFVSHGQNQAAQTWDDDGGGGNGWTLLIQNFTSDERNIESAIYYKIAGASESNPTFTRGSDPGYDLAGTICAIRNVDTNSPFDVAYNNSNHYQDALNDSTPTPPAITTANDDAWVVVFSTVTHNDISAIAAPTNYDLRESLVENNNNHMLATREIASAGTETPGAWTNTAAANDGESHSYTLALRPAGAGVNIIPLIVYHRMMQGIQ